MLASRRQLFFRLFAIFFILITPILVVYSLGYNVDLEKKTLNNTLAIRVQTLPRSASLYQENQELGLRTPTELETEDNAVVPLSIKKEGFLEEEFLIWGAKGRNSATRLNNLWLLPQEPIVLSNLAAPSAKTPLKMENKENLTLLDKSVLWTEKNNKQEQQVFLQNYSISGLQGSILPVNKNSSRELKNLQFRPVGPETYWDQEQSWLLFKLDQKWEILDLQSKLMVGNSENLLSIQPDTVAINPLFVEGKKVASLARNHPQELLVLDNNGQLWLLNLLTKKWQFLDSNFQGLDWSENPETIWLWKEDSIFRLEMNKIQNFNLENNLFIKTPKLLTLLDLENNSPSDLEDNLGNTLENNLANQIISTEEEGSKNLQKFASYSFAQGTLLQFGSTLWHFPDFNVQEWQVLAKEVSFFATTDNTIFWLDKEQNLFSWNALLKLENSFGKMDQICPENEDCDLELFYDYNWQRLLIYKQGQVWSIWFDKDIINNTIIKYFPQKWIDAQQCWPEILDRQQTCLSEQKLASWRNNSLW